jgi:hypothetical protein
VRERKIAAAFAMLTALLSAAGAWAAQPDAGNLAAHFRYLSIHGNSSCSIVFMQSIAMMPPTARLRGSCCAPMVLQRYKEQIRGLAKYAAVSEIPPDPYDIEAALAQRLLAAYDLPMTPAQQRAYDYAMRHADEKGPCCCPCWRWRVYGGLAKLLIRDRGFTDPQVTDVWNLSDGCGGSG